MAKLLLNLRNVPADELEQVCSLLDSHRIGHYRTRPSPWGISSGGVWLEDDGDYPRARRVLDGYQLQRRQAARSEREAALREGRAETFATLLRRRPLYVLATLLGMVLIVALVLGLPFLILAR
ncbi:DUF6164 family protein [Stenotrophomonas sp. MMGLT7]|uniref:DUF6164 family protein n=1 Tax=Stenotrophomonas sp. MMGLT7 TaxID=2901227 RepID=UPI001E45351F|nr:DUF6164 family protein [Stenotrophomonas sp. MMGLT7]MCD7097239.1 DUF6164 family protein [Stenotrophomonas sp. MMGLT7]